MAWNILRGKVDEKMIDELLADPEWVNFLEEFPNLFHRSFGISAKKLQVAGATGRIQKKQALSEEAAKRITEEGGDPKLFERIESLFKRATGKDTQVPGQIVAREADRVPSTFISEEIFSGEFQRWISRLKEKAEMGNRGAAALHWYLTQPMSWLRS